MHRAVTRTYCINVISGKDVATRAVALVMMRNTNGRLKWHGTRAFGGQFIRFCL